MIEPEINEQLGSFAPSQRNADLLQNVVSQESLSMTETIMPRRSFVLPTAPSQPQLDPALKAAVDEMANQRSAVLNSSLYNATKKNPDAVAEAQRVAKQMGVGADIAERNLPELQRGAMMLKALDRNLAVSAPKTANSLTEPDFANIAYDDLENLTGTEKLMRWFAGTDFFKGAQGTFISTEMATIDQLNSEGMATSKDFERYKELQRDLQIVGQPAPYSISGNIANLLASVEAGAEIGAQYAVTGAVLGGAAGAIGGPLAPATMPAGMALGGTAGFATGMAKWMYQAMAGESYRQLREGEVSHEVALPMSRGIGVITSALEFAGLGAEVYIASGLGKKIFSKELATDVTSELSKQMIKKATASEAVWDASKLYFGEILTESTVEGLQTAITRVGTEIGRAYDRSDLQNMFQTPEGRRAIISEAVDSFVNVAIGMSVAGLPLPAANYYMDRGRYADAKRSQQFYEDLSKNAVDSKMRQRNPDAAERFYADQVDGTGAETTYVDGRVMQNILNQSGLTNEQVDTVLPGIRQQLAEAISIGGDVTIPTATYAARLAGTKLGDSMKIHMRPNANAWSADTAVKYAGQLEQEKEKALALLEEKETTDTKFVDEARVIEKDMREKLAAVGRDPKLAKAEATIFRDMMVVAAAEAKMTPAAYMAQHGPDVVGPQAQSASLEQAAKLTLANVEQSFADLGVEQRLSETATTIRPGIIRVPTELRDQGRAATAMQSLLYYADQSGKRIDISPTDEFGANKKRLVAWYKSLGFVENKGKNKDFAISATMYREPRGAAFEQASRIDLGLDEQVSFDEANQRPEVVAWAKEKFGDRTAPDGSSVWQNFTEWFGDSKTVDAEGKPVMVYHGTDKKFTKVNMKKGAQGVFWVASDKSAIESGEAGAARSGVIMELFVSIKNPAGWNEYDNKSIAELIRDGYDGVILRDKDGSFNAIAFTPTQIKSAGENVGTFSKTDASLLKQAAISKMNPKYMAAVKRGDMETAQQMVIEAANAAGYTTLAHHGTDSDPFDVFESADEYNWGQASYFSPNLEYATMYSEISRTGRGEPRVLNVALDLGETFSPETNKEHLKIYRQWAREQERLKGHGAFYVNGPIKGPYGPTKARNVIDYQDQWWIVERIWEAGFDSFTTSESDGKTIAWGVKSPNQIKLIDPVTRDESGKIIPLSKRFNFKSPSILEQAAYRGEHTAPTNDGYAQPLNNLGGIFPDDIYSQDAARLYGTGNEQQDRQAISIIQSARGKPNQSIKIYRAVPLVLSNAEKIADIEKQKAEIQRRGYERWAKKQENPLTYDQLNAELDRLKSLPEEAAVVKPQINNGDWVTISKQYAVEHGESALNGNYKIVTKTVPVKHLFTDGNSIQEWGYDSTAQGILEQAAVPASTYSALDKAVGEVTAKSLAAAGWKEQIKGWVNKGIVKQSEVEWSGLVEYLDMQEGKITKETVSEFLKNNGVKIETVTLGDRGDLVKAAHLRAIDKAEKELTNLHKDDTAIKDEFAIYRKLVEADAPRDQIYQALNPIDERLSFDPDTTYKRLDTYIEEEYDSDQSDTSKFSLYVLPGGKNYREVLVKLPVGFMPPARAISKEGLAARQVVFDKYAPQLQALEKEISNLTYRSTGTDAEAQRLADAGNEREQLETQRDAEANALYRIPSTPEAKPFIFSHWDESNVLVHFRMNDRTDADGKRVLFVEEVQSDWGQEGKKKGFVSPVTQEDINQEEKLRNELIEAKRNVAIAQTQTSVERSRILAKLGFTSYSDIISAGERRNELTNAYNELAANDKEFVIAKEKAALAIAEEIRVSTKYSAAFEATRQTKRPFRAPFVETTDGWLNLGLKHVMLEAVNGGYDRVAFVDGDQSVTRYKEALTDAVDEVEIDRNDDGTYNYKTIKDSKELKAENSVTAERIEELFGKSGGADLIEQADAFPDQINTIKSKDLRIGGEGMRKFYNDVLPAAMNKLLKKYGGEKLGQTKFFKSEGVKVSVKEISNSAVKLIRGDISIEEFRRETDLSKEDVSDGVLEDVSTAIGDRNDKARIRQFANDFAQDIKQKLAGGKKMTQPSFDVTAAFIEKVSQGLPLFQAAPSPGPARGGYDPKRIQILLNSEADAFTFLHELMHWRMDKMIQSVNNGKASPQEIADLDIMIQSFKLGGESQQERLAIWNAMTFEEQRPHWEAIAYNFENYLFEGKAPSVEMQGVFDRMASFIKRVYVSIRDDLNKIYRREFGKDLPVLTDEVRGVMDRMLASEDQIKRKQAMMQMVPMFLTQEESGMDDATYAAYQAMNKEAEDAAVTDLTKASLKQMQWLSGARSRVLKELQAKHDALRKEIRAEVKAEVDAEPIYAAMSILKTGEGRAKNGEMVKFDDKFKLNLESVKKMIPAEDVAKLGFGKYGMVAADGMDPDMAADMFGFSSGDELVLALLSAKPAKEEINARTDKRMMDENGDMNTPQSQEEAVQRALHNEARFRFNAVEVRWLSKATSPVRVFMDAAKLAAQQIIAGKVIRDLRPSEYQAAEAKAAREAADAHSKRRTAAQAAQAAATKERNAGLSGVAAGVPMSEVEAAAAAKGQEAAQKATERESERKARYGDRTPEQVILRAKQIQLLQNQLAREAQDAKDEVAKTVKDFRKFFKADDKLAKTRNMDLVDAARAILSAFGFGKSDKSPVEYIEKLKAYNPVMYAAIEPIVTVSISKSKNYKDLTVEEFRQVREVVDVLWEQSRRDKFVEIEGKMVAVADLVDQLETRLDEIGVPKNVIGDLGAATYKERRILDFYDAKAAIRRVEHWADATDGAKGVGPFTKYIWRPIKDAINAYRMDRNKYVLKYVQLLKQIVLPVGKIESKELNYTFGNGKGGVGKAELLGALMHTGNDSNMRKLLLGRGWATLNEDGTLDTSRWDAFVARMIKQGVLTKSDFEFVQATWDLCEEIKPIAQKAHRAIFGFYFKEIQATSFTNKFGTFRGGYVPAKTDAMIVRDAKRQSKMEELEGDFRNSMPSTGMGFTKSREEQYNEALSMDVRLVTKHIDDVLRFAHVQPAIKDVLKILKNRSFASKLTRIDPAVIDDMLIPWLNRSARQITSEPGRNKPMDKFWKGVRSRTGLSIMTANLRNALQQPTGFFPAMLKVSKTQLGNALLTYMGSPFKTAADVASLSTFMNERLKSQIFDMQDDINEILLNPNAYNKVQKWTNKHGYFLQSAFQNTVDVVTWTAKYNQVLAESKVGASDAKVQREAIQQADAAVRLTQGSMSAEDISASAVGSPFYKTFNQFGDYFNMLANLNVDEYIKVVRDLGWRGNKGKLLNIYILGFMAPALVADAIARSLGSGWDSDDDGYLDDFMDWFFGSQARAAVAMVPFGSAAATAITTAFNSKSYDDRITASPSIAALEAATIGVGKTVINIADDDKDVTGKNVRDVSTLISLATGIPVTVLGRPVGYLVDVNRKKAKPTGPIDVARGLVTGVTKEKDKKK